MDEYDLYLRGFDAGEEVSALGLGRVFGLSEGRAREFVRSLPRVVKRRVREEELDRYEQALQAIGAQYELRRSAIRPAETILIQGGAASRDHDPHGASLTLPPPRLESLSPLEALPALTPPPQPLKAWGEALDVSLPPRLPEIPHAPLVARAPLRAESPIVRGELPPAWQVPGLELDGRPEWLVDGPRSFDDSIIEHAPPLELARVSLADEIEVEAPPRSLPDAPRAVGTIAGRELRVELPALLRWSVRGGIGLSLFVIIVLARQCALGDRGMQQALARFGAPRASASDDPGAAAGPSAGAWLESELHQVANGDKDRVRALCERFMRAGAVAVRIGQTQQSGPVQIASELIVTLPGDAAARRAVLAEQRRFLEGTFGGLVGEVADPPDGVLRVAL